MPLECALFYSNGIKGSNTKAGRNDSSVVIQFNHRVYSPTDDQRGIFTGTRVHAPAELVKEMDIATPLLYKACCDGETLDELQVRWYEIDPTVGNEVLYFTHTLKNVKVASVEDILPNTKTPAQETLRHLERVRLMYEEIEWKHEEGYEFADGWRVPA